MTIEDLAVGIIALNNGRLSGKTRLQKTAHLLDACGAETGLSFFYHHYGPYSAELSAVLDFSERLRAESQVTNNGFLYTTFSSEEPIPDSLGALPANVAKRKLDIIQEYNDVVLELAATMVFLSRNGHPEDYVDETTARKPLKSTKERIKKAMELIQRLEIEMPN